MRDRLNAEAPDQEAGDALAERLHAVERSVAGTPARNLPGVPVQLRLVRERLALDEGRAPASAVGTLEKLSG